MFKLISILFHPFSFLFLGVLLFFNTSTYVNFSYSDDLKKVVYGVIFINTMLIPALIVLYLSKRGIIESIYLERVEDRKIVYVVNFSFYLASLFLLSSLNVPSVIYKFAFGSTLIIGVLFVLALLKQKFSAHLAAFGGLTGALVMFSMRLNTDFLSLIFVVLLLAGLVGMSRIMVKAHQEHEIYLGFFIGFFAQVLIFS